MKFGSIYVFTCTVSVLWVFSCHFKVILTSPPFKVHCLPYYRLQIFEVHVCVSVKQKVTGFFKHKPTRTYRFLCWPRVSLNSSLIELLFTRQCEMPALRWGVSGKKQAVPSFVLLFGWMRGLHCSRPTVQPHQTLSFSALSWAAWPLPSARSGQGRDFGNLPPSLSGCSNMHMVCQSAPKSWNHWSESF